MDRADFIHDKAMWIRKQVTGADLLGKTVNVTSADEMLYAAYLLGLTVPATEKKGTAIGKLRRGK